MSGPVFPALSLWQPWALLVAHGLKWLETRPWAPHRDLIGTRMAFAATASVAKDAKDELRHGAPNSQALLDAVRTCGYKIGWDRKKLVHDMPLGRVMCTAVLLGSYPMLDAQTAARDLPERCLLVGPKRLLLIRPEGDVDATSQLPFGVFEPGRVAWHLGPPTLVEGDHPAKGRQQVWNWRPTSDIGGVDPF